MLKVILSLLILPCFCWATPEVLTMAAEHNRPIVAVFLGEEGCPWSQKIEQELFPSPVFQDKVGSEACIWRVASSRSPDSARWEQHYAIQQFPCILLLDPRGKEFARLDYGACTAAAFSERLVALIQDFQDVCQAIDVGLQHYDETVLQTLYKKASAFSFPCFQQVILAQGLKKEKGTFFHLEKYGILLKKLKLKHPAVLQLRKQLSERDPHNQWGTQYQMALLEFAKRSMTLRKKERVEKVIVPLTQYLDRFGQADVDNRWKVELMIAEFLFEKQALKTAFEYLKRAKEHAPAGARPQILKTVAYMRSKCT